MRKKSTTALSWPTSLITQVTSQLIFIYCQHIKTTDFDPSRQEFLWHKPKSHTKTQNENSGKYNNKFKIPLISDSTPDVSNKNPRFIQTKTSFFPATLWIQAITGQMTYIICSVSLGSPLGSPPSWVFLENLQRNVPRRHTNQRPEPPRLADLPSTWRSSESAPGSLQTPPTKETQPLVFVSVLFLTRAHDRRWAANALFTTIAQDKPLSSNPEEAHAKCMTSPL